MIANMITICLQSKIFLSYSQSNKLCSFLFTILGFCVMVSVQAQEYQPGYGDDRAEIEDLMSRYTFAMDWKDAEAYASVFAEDAVLDWARGEIHGKAAIRKFMEDGIYNLSRDAEEAQWPATTRHFIANKAIKIEGNKAKAVTYWFQVNNNSADRSAAYGLFGHYEDELEKFNGRWLFTRRAIYNEGLQHRSKAGGENPAW
jgi:uncharacterized protein (TIGR02246 family)